MFATCSTLLLLFYCLQLTRSTVTNIKGKGDVLWLFPMVLLTEHTIKSSCFLTGMSPVMKQDRPRSELHGGMKAAGGPAAAFGASIQDHSQAGSGDTYGEVLHPLPCSGSGTSSSPWSKTSCLPMLGLAQTTQHRGGLKCWSLSLQAPGNQQH